MDRRLEAGHAPAPLSVTRPVGGADTAASAVPFVLAAALLSAPLIGFKLPQAIVVVLFGGVILHWLSRGVVEVPNLVWPYAGWVLAMMASFFSLPPNGDRSAFVSYTGVAAIGGLLIVVAYHAYRWAGTLWLSRALAVVPIVLAVGVVSTLEASLTRGNELESLLAARQVETVLGRTNFLAAVVAVVMPHALLGIAVRSRVLDRLLSAAAVAAGLFVVVLSGSRGGLLAVGLSTVLAIAFYRRGARYQQRSGRIIRAALFVSLLAAVVVAIMYAGDMINFLVGRRWASIGTLSGRLVLWEDIFEALRDGAFLLGAGAGQLTGERMVTFPHNYLLKAWIWAGIPGLLAMLLITGMLLRLVLRYWGLARVVRHREGPGMIRALELGAAVAAGTTAGLVHSLVEITMGSPGFDLFFWTSAGLLIAAVEHLHEASHENVGPEHRVSTHVPRPRAGSH